MSFISSFSISTEITTPFPFRIHAVKFSQEIKLDQNLTIFMGANGCGKTTLLESLAFKLHLPLVGGAIREDDKTFQAARLISPYLKMKFLRRPKNGFFFRPEDIPALIHLSQSRDNYLYNEYRHLGLKESISREMSRSQNYGLRYMNENYGEDLANLSHGQATMSVLLNKIFSSQIVILDEPENGLVPEMQLHLVRMLRETAFLDDRQFIISTHSPIIASIPNATLFNIEENGINRTKYRNTEHYRIAKGILDSAGDNDP